MAFIVFEGIDGCGKSTLIGRLEQYLLAQNVSLYLTREPGGTPLAEEIRELIIRKGDEVPHPRAELLLYEAARVQHVEQVIRPQLSQGKWVLCDRFTASTKAFQAGGRGLEASDIQWLNDFAVKGVQPDLCVLLDLPVEEAHKRRLKREASGQEADRFESEKKEFHERVRENYLKQVQEAREPWLVLNASLSPEDLFEQLILELKAIKCLS